MIHPRFVPLKNLYMAGAVITPALWAQSPQEQTPRPNIIVILADDLGYGDVSAYRSGTIKTPNIDRLANQGIRFTRGYSTSATSTPSRYALMTGMYPWKNKDAKILPGDAPLIISTQEQTLSKLMLQAGYKTAAIGKWHLGLGQGNVDWNRKVKPNPEELGFEYSYIQAATNDRVPCVYVENGEVDGLDPSDPIQVSYTKNFEGEPTGKENPELLKMHPSHGHDMAIVNGVSRIGFMKGGEAARWTDETMAERFLLKAQRFMTQNQNNPFFLYFGLHQPHVPRVPNEQFAGKSGMGPRGDAILEADWMVGELLAQLDRLELTDNTLIVFSSDNGPVLDDGYKDMAVELLGTHKPSGPFRGGKYSLFEAGTRVPFIVSWPKEIKPGISDAMICQMDLLASLGSIIHTPVAPGKDSQDLSAALTGKSRIGRKDLILEGIQNLAYREGDWILIPPQKRERYLYHTGTETGCSADTQLYYIQTDIYQQHNLSSQQPERVERMMKQMEELTREASSVIR